MPSPEPYGIVKEKGAVFGDDNFAIVADEDSPYTNQKGIEMKKYLLVPTAHLIKQYPELQKPGAMPIPTRYGSAVWKEYPTYWISDENPSRTNALVRIDCGFDGRPTSQTKRYKRYTDEIMSLKEELQNVTISNIHLMEENKMLLGDKKELIKDILEIAEMVRGEKRGDEQGQMQTPS